jgi:ATP-dependent DNA helicase RecQ
LPSARPRQSLDDLQGISGIGAKKLEAYGEEVLRVVAAETSHGG